MKNTSLDANSGYNFLLAQLLLLYYVFLPEFDEESFCTFVEW